MDGKYDVFRRTIPNKVPSGNNARITSQTHTRENVKIKVTFELGRYEFRAKLVEDHIQHELSIPAEVYISPNGLKFHPNLNYNTLPEEKICNIVKDPITILGRKFDHERVLTHVVNSKCELSPTNTKRVQINLPGITGAYSAEKVVALLIKQLMHRIEKQFLNNVANSYELTILIQYPIKYTSDMKIAYDNAITTSKLAAVTIQPQSIDEVLSLKSEHRDNNILFLDMGYKSTRIYILRIGTKLPFRHKVIDEWEFSCGGRQFDTLLYNRFITSMNKIPVTSLEEEKIMQLCDQLKKQLSNTTEATFVYEDFSDCITRQEFERMIKSFVHIIFRKYMNMSMKHGVIAYFERGGCTLIPCISKKIEELKESLFEDLNDRTDE